MGDFEEKITSFTDTLFSWSLDDISNENLYQDMVEKIPDSFESVESYLGSYVYPLLEETRAQVFSSMDVLDRAPFAEVVAFEETSPRGTKLYQITVDYWRNRYNDRSKEPYKTLPGDLLVITNSKPETLSDLGRVGRSWAFLSVTNITEEFENETKEGITVSVSVSSKYFKVQGSKELELEFEKWSSLFVVYLVNTIPNSRTWKALHMMRNPMILNNVLCIDDSLSDHDLDVCSEGNNSFLYESHITELGSDLNKSQNKAVLACLHNLDCKKKSAFELIWGPPGTGKTKTIATLLVALLKMKVRTLICAPTNVAITEVASRVMKMIADSKAEDQICSFGDMLLFGNKERLKVESKSDIQEIYLEHRVLRLGECFGPVGLSNCLMSVITFLEDCVPQYHVFLENEAIREREEKEREAMESEKEKKSNKAKKDSKQKMHFKKERELIEEQEESIQTKVKPFLEYVRERFFATVEPLRKCISIFCTHIPKRYILEHNFQNLMFLLGHLDSLESILFGVNVVSQQLEELFSRSKDNEDPSDSFVDKMSLPSVKNACLSFLRSLQSSLKELKLPSYRNEEIINSFCFQRASLVFCTVSTSYKLHRMDIAPMNVLVIDEAAQLKECESTIPLQLPGIEKAVLVGDECQLPATITSKIAEGAGFGRSLFERLSSQNHPKHLLNVQYRMHPSISSFPNSQFYQNRIQDSSFVKKKSYEKHCLQGPMFGTYSFLNVIGGREEKDDDGHSRKNMVEVAIVLKIVKMLHKAWLESGTEVSVGIVSPYAAQVVAIQEKLGKKFDGCNRFQVKAKTVDGFQGGEDDIIIMSTVRSDIGRSLEFISDPRRVNVALTRARHCLWVLGNERTLTNGQSIWGILVVDAKNRGCFYNVDDDKHLAKTILEVKKELDQFDDLLHSDSVVFKNSKWKVLFSDNFLKSFKKLTSARIKKSVLNLLLKLSGGWRPKRQVLASGGEGSLEIMKFRVEGLNVICTVDIQKGSKYVQVLRIWDVLAPDDISKLVKRLEGIFGKYSDEFIRLCCEKSFEGDLEVPKTWPPSMEITQIKDLSVNETGSDLVDVASEGRSYLENSRVSESLLLMKFYSLSHSVVNHLLSDRDGRELDLPFEVTDQEMEIVIFPRSTFILGRSGTGKTTVLTMKLFQKEKLYHEAVSKLCIDNSNSEVGESSLDCMTSSENNKVSVLRQLFVTVSPKLCNAVKKHVSDLKSFACGGSDSEGKKSSEMEAIDDEEEQFKNVPDSFTDIAANSYPLVVTFHKFLMMLDGSLSKSYFEKFLDISSVSHNTNRTSRSVALQTFLRTKEVNFDKFSASYWPHFNAKLTKKLDPSRVFTEIISHIKGGPQAMDSDDFKLGRDDYVRLSNGRSSTLTGQKRETIFEIFQMYEKLKIERGEFDLSDFVINLHCRLRHESYEGDQMDFVYIDEVQDLTMSQIALFRHICLNVEEGFVFSGDTAQTIARGIDFRFQDIRSLFYKKFLGERAEKGRLSEIYSLSQNFRTHAGILKLSQSIVELLYHFFPQAIDVLSPETSLIYGEAPVLLQSVDSDNAIVKIFGNNAKGGSGKIVGFGAEQVILVRDDNARREISDIVGKQALLLTVLECKGLEFQDVLLYNFFGSSPMRNQWRVIYEYMKEMDMFDNSEPPNCPKFSESKHNILCSELKQLYVAVTRTRQRLWICENAELPDSEPMFDYWKKKCLVQVRQLDDSLAQAMQVSSSPEEWRSRGIKLFYEKNYEWATVCFERAHDKYWEQMSKASGLKAMADNMRTSKPEEANSILREAAEIFETIGKADFAAKCFADLGEYERAGRIYLEKFGGSELAKAAECFSLAGCYELSANVYARGNFFSECLTICSKGKLFDLGLGYINEWKQGSIKECGTSKRGQEIEKLEQVFLENCAFHYHETKDKRSMMKFVRAFNSMDSIRNFLRPLGCFDELLSLEEESGNFLEAANIAKRKGDILLLIDLLGKAQKFKEASTLVLFYVFAKSLWSPGNGWPLKQFKQKTELLTKAKCFAKSESQSFYELVCVEADIIMSKEESDLSAIVNQLLTSRKHKSVRGEILSLRKALEFHLSSKPSKYFSEEELVSDPKRYSEETMLQIRISIESLVYCWDSWKNEISNGFEYLSHIVTEDVNEHRNHGDFCLNFFGVWRQFQNSNPVYLLLFSDAEWARKVVKRPLWNSGLLVSIDVHQLASSARAYLCSEYLSVGMKVLDELKSIYTFEIKNWGSPFRRSNILSFIYLVANSLLESKHLKLSFQDSKALKGLISMVVDDFVAQLFPSGLQRSVTSSSMVHLRGTDVSKAVLTRFIAKYAGSTCLSYGQIGNIAMIVMGSGIITDELYAKIVEGLNWNPPWEALLRDLCAIRKSSNNGGETVHLIRRLVEALSDALNVNLSKIHDYISPHCFFYLVESLINLAASTQGHFVATKSSFVEWLVHQENDLSVPNPGQFLETIREFTVHVVKLWLNNTNDLIEWIKRSYRSVKEHYPLLVTRMIVIVCLLQANFGNCKGLLFMFLRRQDIRQQLPREFGDILARGKDCRYLNVLSEAFKKIGDPLVIVDLGGNKTPAVLCPHTVFVDMKSSRSKDEILVTLFPRNTRKDSQREVVSTSNSPKVPNPKLDCDQNESNCGSESKFFWDVFEETWSPEAVTKHGEFYAKKIKENLEKCTPLATVGDSQEIHFKTPKEQNQFFELLDDLKQLQGALDTSELNFLNRVSSMKEVCKRLQSRRPTMEPILNQWLSNQAIDHGDHVLDGSKISEIKSKGVESNAPMDSESFWDVFEDIFSLEDFTKHGQFYSKKIKDNVEKCEPFLMVDNQNKTPEGLNQFVEELKQLQANMDSSHKFPVRVSSVRELCKRLQSRRPTIEPILNRMLSKQVTDTGDHFEDSETAVDEAGDPFGEQDSDAAAEKDKVSEMDRSEVSQANLVTETGNNSKTKGKGKGKGQGQGKNKNVNKSKKKKGKR